MHLGMRSGAMDAAALLGMRTRFIENAGNQQIARTSKWVGASNSNPLYQRIPVSELSTRTARAMAKHENHVTARFKDEEIKGYLPEDLKLIVDSVEAALA